MKKIEKKLEELENRIKALEQRPIYVPYFTPYPQQPTYPTYPTYPVVTFSTF